MRVQWVVMPGSEAESWTLLGDDQIPLDPVTGVPGLDREVAEHGQGLRPRRGHLGQRIDQARSSAPS